MMAATYHRDMIIAIFVVASWRVCVCTHRFFCVCFCTAIIIGPCSQGERGTHPLNLLFVCLFFFLSFVLAGDDDTVTFGSGILKWPAWGFFLVVVVCVFFVCGEKGCVCVCVCLVVVVC